jgi:dTDP-L-rhamnose 4-epimerase
MRKVLVTGGAGFIGSHVGRELLAAGYAVRALDSLAPQVHGGLQESARRPAYLDPEIELQVGDVRDPRALDRALDGVDGVVHLAAQVGVGQSLYRIADYVSVNSVGTATLLEALQRRPVERLVVASSLCVYGEGAFRDAQDRLVSGAERTRTQLESREWEVRGPAGEPLTPVPTSEDKPASLGSVYAVGKYEQERLCLLFGRAYDVHVCALRLFNVYGPHRELGPHAGVLAIFAARLSSGRAPLLFEDGRQQRDFVSVHDVARAFRLALERPQANQRVLNIGSGGSHNVLEAALLVAGALKIADLPPVVTGKHRPGDVRHCFADITAAQTALGFRPSVSLEAGLAELGEWIEGQVADGRFSAA